MHLLNSRRGTLKALPVVLGLVSILSSDVLAQVSKINTYSIAPNWNVSDITTGPDGALWFTDCQQSSCATAAIGRITTTGDVTEYPTPNRAPGAITTGPDGALWFTDVHTNSIGRICASSLSVECAFVGYVTEYPISTPSSFPGAIKMGADGALWFVERTTNKIGRVCAATTSLNCPATGYVTEYPIMSPNSGALKITAGPDGAMWFTEGSVSKIGRICVSVAPPACPAIGSMTEYQTPTPNSSPYDITAGPDGALWFTESIGEIGRITVTGQISEYPANRGYDEPLSIITGPDGALWFTSFYATYYPYLGRMNTTGAFPTYYTADGYPMGLTSGPDGSIWIGSWFTSGIEQVVLPLKPVVIVVPGIGASALTDGTGVNQWLSCASIYGMHNNGLIAPLQYDINGTPLAALTPTEILAQSDSVADVIKPFTQSIIQCDTNFLVENVACATGWLNCASARSLELVGARSQIQSSLVSGSQGALLQFNDPSNSLLATLANNGFTPQAWKYDFRRDISALADDLYIMIQQVASSNPGRPIAIVAHSMGSVITAAMITQHPTVYTSGLLTNVISMAAPFGGSIDTYLYAQGWRAFVPFLSAHNTALLAQNWTSVYQLLPQQPFVAPFSLLPVTPPSVTQVFTGQFDPINFPVLPRASIVPDASDPTSVWGEINRLGTQPFWSAIIGYGQPTNGKIVQAFTAPDYSKPCYQIEQDDGDGTVPLSSARASLIPANRIYVNDKHAQLPKNPYVISGILNILNGTSPFIVPNLLPENQVPAFTIQDTILVNACSPVAVSATNSSGETINSQVAQIQNATYANIGTATQVALPWNDMFQVQITGTGSGTFDLVVNGLGGQHAPISYFFKKVPVQKGSQGTLMVGGTTLPSLQYNYAGKNVIDTLPPNTNPPTIICTGCYFMIQNLRATIAFNVGYQGGLSTFTYNYRGLSQTLQFVSTSTQQITVSSNKATFSGQGTLNNQVGYSFAVTATDGGPAGSGLDTVLVTITGPNNYSYSATGTVVGGDVIVHQ